MTRIRLFTSLMFVNLGLFVATVAFLPRAGVFGWNSGNPISYLVNSRTDWDIAWLMLLAGILVSVGVSLLIRPRD